LGGGASPVSYEIAKGYAKLGHKEVLNNQGTLFKARSQEDLRNKLKELMKMKKIKPPKKPKEFYWENVIEEYEGVGG